MDHKMEPNQKTIDEQLVGKGAGMRQACAIIRKALAYCMTEGLKSISPITFLGTLRIQEKQNEKVLQRLIDMGVLEQINSDNDSQKRYLINKDTLANKVLEFYHKC